MRKMKKKNINLFEQYEKAVGKGTRKKISRKTLYLLGGAGLMAVLVGVYLILFFQTRSVQNKYDELYSKIYSADAAEQSVNVTQLEYENQVLSLITNKYVSNMKSIEKKNKETANLSPELIKNILSCCGENTWVKNISYDQGIVFINGEANDAVNASGFVSELDKKGIFSYVNYTGYNRQGNVFAFSATGYFDTESDGSGKTVAEETGGNE
jgi:hypothetical protein